ncbi:MAG TPA: lytic transglycosylase domain-containing protein [Allosphingosinicella sp.]|nr:lytic transglycosylase domain-containing protein [Allosphingosinicella sp.]
MKRLAALLCAGLIYATAPAPAPALAATDDRASASRAFAAPAQLSEAERENYRAIFAALRARDWAQAAGRLDEMRPGLLHDFARAQLFTMPGSPRVEGGPLVQLLGRAPDLPQAATLARLAGTRGVEELPAIPEAQRLYGLPGQPRRARPRPVRGDAVADQLEPLISPLIRDDKPVEAEALLATRSAELTTEARIAFQQRIAWVYYLNGNDRDARRIADLCRTGSSDFALQAEWVAGLAAWRMGDYADAARHFADVATRSTDVELAAAGHYWAARADTAGGHPDRVQARLRAAARHGETFYGLLAQSALGMHGPPADMTTFTERDWHALRDVRNARIAIALSEIGESQLASDVIRHQARIGNPRDHEPLIHLAARLNLTATQMYLSHNGPRGAHFGPAERYPTPSWRPANGWRVDQALAFAHALQESTFRPDVTSPAGARGLMQVLPGTSQWMARVNAGARTADPSRLFDPATNLEYGQTFMEYLRDYSGTGGLLPKVIASYNAGPAPIAAWNTRYDQSDPLLYIESIPYWETRGYVPIILRNYWIYEDEGADRSSSRRALAAGLWPRFPGLPGPTAVRIATQRDVAMTAD